MRIISTAVEKSGLVGFGVTLSSHRFTGSAGTHVGSRECQNPYTAELQAISTILKSLANQRSHLSAITLITANLSALQALSKPTRQSGQGEIGKIYAAKMLLDLNHVLIKWIWVPMIVALKERDSAKAAAHQVALTVKKSSVWAAKSSLVAHLRANIMNKVIFSPRIGKAIKELDYALPGPHTKMIYDGLSKEDAKIIAQLRTGDAKLNMFLIRIKAVESATCACGAAPESIRHFLFSCPRWIGQRRELYTKYPGKEGNIRFFLGAKGPQDNYTWKPNVGAVRATVCYVKATKRFEDEDEA